MSILRAVARGLVVASLATAGVLMTGRSEPLQAQTTDANGCVLGGPGVLCSQKQVQTCTDWRFVSFTAGTSLSMGITCSRWETVTLYYYRDPAGASTKPGLK